MIFQYFIFLLTTINASDMNSICGDNMFKRVHRVVQSNLGLNTNRSNTQIRNRVMCAKHCINEGCLSFSYTEVDKRCDTYSRLIVEEKDVEVSNSTMYFSKDLGVLVINSCSDVPQGYPSGIYPTTTAGGGTLLMFCDIDTADGPWVVIQRRTSGDVDFYRNWADYKNGFGDILENYWIGNDNLYALTSTTSKILRVELEAWDGRKGYAQYSTFYVANEAQNYRLSVFGFSGNVHLDALALHNGNEFSTYDNDNDGCAGRYHGGWWYVDCYQTNLNGPFKLSDAVGNSIAMIWMKFPDIEQDFIPLKKSKMMIR